MEARVEKRRARAPAGPSDGGRTRPPGRTRGRCKPASAAAASVSARRMCVLHILSCIALAAAARVAPPGRPSARAGAATRRRSQGGSVLPALVQLGAAHALGRRRARSVVLRHQQRRLPRGGPQRRRRFARVARPPPPPAPASRARRRAGRAARRPLTSAAGIGSASACLAWRRPSRSLPAAAQPVVRGAPSRSPSAPGRVRAGARACRGHGRGVRRCVTAGAARGAPPSGRRSSSRRLAEGEAREGQRARGPCSSAGRATAAGQDLARATAALSA